MAMGSTGRGERGENRFACGPPKTEDPLGWLERVQANLTVIPISARLAYHATIMP
jgi:hypothetical protein